MPRALALLIAALFALALFPAPGLASPASQTVSDPSKYFPDDAALPAGFVHMAQGDDQLRRPEMRGAARQYVRQNPEVAPDDITLLRIQIFTGADLATTQDIYGELTESSMSEGFWLTSAAGTVGDEAMTGTLPIGSDGRGEGEIATVVFRQGNVAVGVEWMDYEGLPNLENALDVARTIANQLP